MNYSAELTPIRPTSTKYPGLTFHNGNDLLKKTDPNYKDRIVSDDSKFDIFSEPNIKLSSESIKLGSIESFESLVVMLLVSILKQWAVLADNVSLMGQT